MQIPITDITPEQIKFILERLAVLNEDYTRMSADVAVLKVQMASMVFWTRTIVAAFIGLLVTQMWQIVLMKKNNNK